MTNDNDMTVFNDDAPEPSGHVSPVKQVGDEWSFTVMTGEGRPIATFVYSNEKKAQTYVGVMEELIGYAKAIMKPADDDAGWMAPNIVR
ncbi:MAG TPA: hypothetical protein VKR31_07180 [Rhizomicrobium sp.]|nr:hypothetical protein [Rhizomicrobium sp.]